MRFAFSTVVARPLDGVKVDATGTENTLYFTGFFSKRTESPREGVSFILEASFTEGVYGFTTITVSLPKGLSWAKRTPPDKIEIKNRLLFIEGICIYMFLKLG